MKKLYELFDSHYDFKHHHTSSNGRNHEYGFHAKDSEYSVQIIHRDKNTAYVGFHDEEGQYHNNNSHPRDAHKVFGTVKHIVKHHLSKHPDIKNVTWSAKTNDGKNTSRHKLYSKMAKKEGKYKEEKDDDIEDHQYATLHVKESESTLPVNNASSGNVSGLGTGNNEPGIKKKRKLLSFGMFVRKGKTNGTTT